MERPLINANLKLAEESVALEESYLSAQARLNGLIQDQSRLMSGLDDLCYKHQKSKMVRFAFCVYLSFKKKLTRDTRTTQRFSTTSVRERFSKAIQEADGESERLLLEFQAGTLPPDKFLKEYRASRRLVHLRSGRMERLGAPIDDSQEDEDVWSQNRFRD